MDLSGISLPIVASLALVGLINGTLYAMLSMGIAIVFGILKIVNFANGAQYMLGAFAAWLLLNRFGVPYWVSIVVVPLGVGAVSMLIERRLLRQLYDLHHLYGFLATFGVALIIEGLLQQFYGISGRAYEVPALLQGSFDLGFMHLPVYRAWVLGAGIVVCLATWLSIEKTKLGSYLRASAQNAKLVEAFGINVPILLMAAYGFGGALAALGGVLAAPIFPVSPAMAGNMTIIVFAVVVIGGMGSIPGAIVAGLVLGLIEGLINIVYPQAASTVIFIIMIIVLIVRPTGLFSRSSTMRGGAEPSADLGFNSESTLGAKRITLGLGVAVLLVLAVLPFHTYPVFMTHALCLAIFACSFNLLLGYTGMLSFGHAAYFGIASYMTGYLLRDHGATPEIAIVGGALAAAFAGLVFGWLAVRLHGIYFAMATLALAQLVYFFFVQFKATGGEEGMQNIPRGKLFGIVNMTSETSVYFLVLVCFLAALAAMYRIVHSPFGQKLQAIRENETRAISLGIDVERHKLLIFVLSASIAGVAGSLKAIAMQFVTLSDVHWSLSGAAVVMTLIGGAATFLGPAIGALVIVSTDTWLADAGISLHLTHGIVLLICILAFRGGIAGSFDRIISRWFPGKPKQREPRRRTERHA